MAEKYYVKITAIPEFFRFTNRVHEKPDGQSPQGQQQGNPEQGKQSKDEEAKREASPEEIGQAIALFETDAKAREAGLKAESIGSGPGLKVVLRDGQGAVVRQFTGAEFLKLREAASKDPRTRGKILDQKF
jgi:hypothetical protein